jgi:hypothetical protein
MSRRALLQASAGAAALAAVPISALSSGAAAAARRATTPSPDAEAAGLALGGDQPSGPVMFCVHDAARGEVAVLQGGHEVIVRDRQLVARIMQAAARRSV